ncbi:hypothetical protein BU26DRAFT_605984 [Trematosphaeria pertusa]|uniref:Ecp2 effector protein domain-containing protein n=1 Tax=Trematosphaeria pertusa TaxID=390896 RepID=A0A6A6ID79_9PLEO|nr:uncharacterized protein BU26DRAFT_605984 [Trematosphaeria pertusa]KAF2248535.1 hypothetical protein BU26DRAFT_605984 [Trematosphaeria pertusa]
MRTELFILLASISCFSSTAALPANSAVSTTHDPRATIEEHPLDKRQDTYEQIICERAADGTDTVGGYRDDGYGIATWLEGLGGGNQDCTLERRAGTTDFVVAMIGGNERTEVNIYFTERDPQAYRVTFKCKFVGAMLRELVQLCTQKGQTRLRSRRWLPNCNVTGLAWTGSTEPLEEGGAMLEIAETGFR